MAGRDRLSRLAEDARTANVGGDRHVLNVLALKVTDLWALLDHGEPAVWAALSTGPLEPPPPGQGRWARWTSAGESWAVVRTPTRLLLLPTLPGSGLPVTVDGPWTTQSGPSNDPLATTLTVTGAGSDHRPLSLKILGGNVLPLLWETDLGPVGTGSDPASVPGPRTDAAPGRGAGQAAGADRAPGAGDGPAAPGGGGRPEEDPSGAWPPRPPEEGTPVPGAGGWIWNRPVVTWQAAEELAVAHMRHLGFTDVRLTRSGADQGIDAIATGAAAQVKFHSKTTGAPDVQRLAGAAHGIPNQMFYAMSFTPAALRAAEITGVALFVYETSEGAVTPGNGPARVLSPARPGTDARSGLGSLSFDGRRTRALRWMGQVQEAAKAPLSNRKRKAERQREQRREALTHVLQAGYLIDAAGSPDCRRRRAERMLRDAEKLLRDAARLVGARLL